ncbi:MAG TPA: tectonin domain-containing protein [Aggregatilineales bacterium]|nr:tectonin domain-containing protein [Aggregatilineales bacterium]
MAAVKLTNVSVGDDGTIWTIDSLNRVWAREAGRTIWKQVENVSAVQVSVGRQDHIWLLNADGNLYRRDKGQWEFQRLTVRFMDIAAGSDGTVFAVDRDQGIWFRTYVNPAWQRDPVAKAVNVAVGSRDHIWSVTADGDLYQRVQDKWAFRSKHVGAISISAGADGSVFYIDPGLALYELIGDKWQARPVHPSIQVSVRHRKELWCIGVGGELWHILDKLWTRVPHPAETVQKTYVVQRGDTMGKIATLYKLTLPALIKANPQIKNPDRIEVGDVINIPTV